MTRVKLSREHVLYIYMFKVQAGEQFLDKCQRNRWMHALAREMGVTSKTIRDIWNGKSWAHLTSPTWETAPGSVDDDLFCVWDEFWADGPGGDALDDASPASFLRLDEEPVAASLVIEEAYELNRHYHHSSSVVVQSEYFVDRCVNRAVERFWGK